MSNFLYPQPDNVNSQVTSSTPMLSFSTVSEKRSWLSQSVNHPSQLDKSHERNSELSRLQLEHHRLLTRNRLIWRRVKASLKALILLLLSTGYLAFCYTVNRRVVPLKSLGPYSITPDNFETVKSAITTLNIALVTLALYPISDILLELKSEEFFHALAERRRRGVPLSTINTISSPLFGILDSIHAIIARRCSRFFVAATVGHLIAFATSILAPAALSIQSVLADGDIVALPAGAVINNSVYNTTVVPGFAYEYYVESNAEFAASILWAEMSLGVQYNFSVAASLEADISAFIVPQPLNLPMTSTARWLTDVIGLGSSCIWASTNITQPIIVPDGYSFLSQVGVYLEELDLDMIMYPTGVESPFQASIIVKNPASDLFNHTTLMPPTDGSTVFLVSQCVEGCDPAYTYHAWFDFTGIPTFTLELPPSITFGQTQSWKVACLVCKPNAVIETREVRAEGGAMLSVQPLSEGKQLMRQGNLFPLDTTTMLSFALSSIQDAGPFSYSTTMGLGSQPLVKFLFGSKQVESWPGSYGGSGSEFVNVTFLPVANLSTCFGQMLQSASKAYLSGYLGAAYVPARLSTLEVVFMSSLPLVLISTATFLLLYIFLGLLRLHKKGEKFNLSNIARIIHGSNLPEEMSLLAQEIDDGTGKYIEQDVIGQIGDRTVVLQEHVDGSDVLQLS